MPPTTYANLLENSGCEAKRHQVGGLRATVVLGFGLGPRCFRCIQFCLCWSWHGWVLAPTFRFTSLVGLKFPFGAGLPLGLL